MGEPIAEPKKGQQLNRILGDNTVFFHQQGPGQSKGMPNPGVLSTTGGTPNQKAERIANRLAFFHFVQPNSAQAEAALSDAIDFFRGQLRTGHQCIAKADEALTGSHSPIWWRAITSMRITTHSLADRGGDYAALASLVLDWLQFHTSLNTLGEITSGVNAGKVLLPGSRWKGDPNNDCVCATPEAGGKRYVKEPLTDQVNNVIHQLITKGKAPWSLPGKFFVLREEAQDLAGAALARQIIDSGIGFGEDVTKFRLPQLRSTMTVTRFANGHRASFPQGMPFAGKPALDGYADYEAGQMCLSRTVDACPPPSFSGEVEETVVQAVPA
jgi:hypothetical protein